jgi:hypothetical protein
VRYEIRPLLAWTDPVTENRRTSATFRAPWSSTLELLERETALLGAELVVIQVDADETQIRRDGMLRARARVGHPGVVVSFNSDHGPLRYATDTYEGVWSGDMPGWQANVRAIALALEALRAVDRYGVTRRAEQYVGFRALPAGPPAGFATADEALRWMREQAEPHLSGSAPAKVYRHLARRLHPDAGTGSREQWDRLDAARQLLERTGEL